jgi:hypothetical protein
MQSYRIRAFRRQLVEIVVYAHDEEWAWENALDANKDAWEVLETYEVEEYESLLPDQLDPDYEYDQWRADHD